MHNAGIIIISDEKIQKIIEDIRLKANNNSERQAYISLREYGIAANSENTKYILNLLLEQGVISSGKPDGKGIINCKIPKKQLY